MDIIPICEGYKGHCRDTSLISNFNDITNEDMKLMEAVYREGWPIYYIGDYVEYNFTQGEIEYFGLADSNVVLVKIKGTEEMYGLSHMRHKTKVPSRFQTNHLVKSTFRDFTIRQAKVLSVSFTSNKTMYNLEVFFFREDTAEGEKMIPISSIRVYNVDGSILEPYE